jgi:exodeoxyribonuclease VII large subunit
MYYTLKDKDSKMKCLMFARANAKLTFAPKEGMKVLARGSVSVYDRDGTVQFYVTEMQPDGLGSLYLAYEQLKNKLEMEGLFSRERKRAIPAFPRVVGVITSPTGAAVRDIMTTLARRFPAIPVLLIPAQVQGDLAAPSLVKAIQTMNRSQTIDVIIVGRGGGSLEELWAFNEETVARAIAGSRIPIISAVGHETDFTIADFVADLRAPTPTAAAELAVPDRRALIEQLKQMQTRMSQALSTRLKINQQRLDRVTKHPIFQSPTRLLDQPYQKLDRAHVQLQMRIERLMNRAKETLSGTQARLERTTPKHLIMRFKDQQIHFQTRLNQVIGAIHSNKQQSFTSLIRQLDALSPLKVMSRGYSLTYDAKTKKLVKSTNQVQPGDVLQVRVTDGSLSCHVVAIEGDK